MNLQLHPDWASAWKWSSTWLNALVIAAPVLYVQLQQLQGYLPAKVFLYGMAGIGVLNLINTIRAKAPS